MKPFGGDEYLNRNMVTGMPYKEQLTLPKGICVDSVYVRAIRTTEKYKKIFTRDKIKEPWCIYLAREEAENLKAAVFSGQTAYTLSDENKSELDLKMEDHPGCIGKINGFYIIDTFKKAFITLEE
jgi:hypothetical protein